LIDFSFLNDVVFEFRFFSTVYKFLPGSESTLLNVIAPFTILCKILGLELVYDRIELAEKGVLRIFIQLRESLIEVCEEVDVVDSLLLLNRFGHKGPKVNIIVTKLYKLVRKIDHQALIEGAICSPFLNHQRLVDVNQALHKVFFWERFAFKETAY
jgi:hypothetical protein